MPDLPDACRIWVSLDRRQFLLGVGITGTILLGSNAVPSVLPTPRYLANEAGERLTDENGNALIVP